jgi:hypothetical protein
MRVGADGRPGTGQRRQDVRRGARPIEIYVYRNETFGAAVTMEVFIDGRAIGQTVSKTYVVAEVDPGPHKITGKAEVEDSLDLTTVAGADLLRLAGSEDGRPLCPQQAPADGRHRWQGRRAGVQAGRIKIAKGHPHGDVRIRAHQVHARVPREASRGTRIAEEGPCGLVGPCRRGAHPARTREPFAKAGGNEYLFKPLSEKEQEKK